MEKSSKYGLCHVCQNPITIPGLDAYHCSKCGWVKRPKKYELQSQISINEYRSRKYSTSEKVPSTEDGQMSLFD